MSAMKKTDKFPIMLLGLNQIRVDHAIQSRVATSMEYQREFSEAMLRGEVFPAVVVFFDGKVYWLADGFHRHGAAKMAARVDRKLENIKAEVRPGTREDAIVFSAGANKQFSIKRTSEDIRKAFYMLFAMPEWWGKSNTAIAAHIGASVVTATRHRASYAAENRVDVPDSYENSLGHIVSRPTSRRKVLDGRSLPKLTRPSGKTKAFTAEFNGKKFTLGDCEKTAKQRLASIIERERAQVESKRLSLKTAHLSVAFAVGGLAFAGTGSSIEANHAISFGLTGIAGHGCVVLGDGDRAESEVQKVGRVLLLRAAVDPGARAIIACYREDWPPVIVELGQKIGVEFLSPDEIIASLKNDTPTASPASAPPPDRTPSSRGAWPAPSGSSGPSRGGSTRR